jgi:hypothetical protein
MQNAGMPSITIRDVPAAARDERARGPQRPDGRSSGTSEVN